ncbi:PadR family transcriptional regulator [Salinarchaeum sp. IM2453]|uniref:PadR family transcriptional regulator n=1 Tax=Salinarchaeum sp. IM2453 TaxID=2862870 RepID=UPI001C83269C|nr:PadR family transcriptional regulator [Salinarchaeum sp. IM2453]QZA89547.1 PadR family transcriptional regulator [Salinarchaeum sp. IM2453]
MSRNDSSGQKSPDTEVVSLNNCSVCHFTDGSSGEGQDKHNSKPREHTANSSSSILPDGGTGYTDLSGFQRDILLTTLVIARDSTTDTSGTNIQDYLEARYGEEINHSRLYKNIHRLTDLGLLSKSTIDGRTNCYELTTEGTRLLSQQLNELVCALSSGEADTHQIGINDRQLSVSQELEFHCLIEGKEDE